MNDVFDGLYLGNGALEIDSEGFFVVKTEKGRICVVPHYNSLFLGSNRR